MNKRKAANTGGGTIGCAICWRDEKKKVQYPKNTKGLVALIDHWKKIPPGIVYIPADTSKPKFEPGDHVVASSNPVSPTLSARRHTGQPEAA